MSVQNSETHFNSTMKTLIAHLSRSREAVTSLCMGAAVEMQTDFTPDLSVSKNASDRKHYDRKLIKTIKELGIMGIFVV